MRFVVLFLLAGWIGCASSERTVDADRPIAQASVPDDDAPSGPSAPAAPAAPVDALLDGPLPDTPGAVRERLGAPTDVRTDTRPNRHVDGATDTLTTLVYPTGSVTLFSGSATDNRFTTEVRLTRTGASTPEGFTVGARLFDVRAERGRPIQVTESGEWMYEVSPSDLLPATVVLEPDASGERIAAIRYVLPMD
jgi:hypothetical protein